MGMDVWPPAVAAGFLATFCNQQHQDTLMHLTLAVTMDQLPIFSH
jgi:hypothetical protein